VVRRCGWLLAPFSADRQTERPPEVWSGAPPHPPPRGKRAGRGGGGGWLSEAVEGSLFTGRGQKSPPSGPEGGWRRKKWPDRRITEQAGILHSARLLRVAENEGKRPFSGDAIPGDLGWHGTWGLACVQFWREMARKPPPFPLLLGRAEGRAEGRGRRLTTRTETFAFAFALTGRGAGGARKTRTCGQTMRIS